MLVGAPGLVTRSAVPKRTAASRARLRQSNRLLSAATRSSVGVWSVRLPSLSPASTSEHSRSESCLISRRSAISFCATASCEAHVALRVGVLGVPGSPSSGWPGVSIFLNASMPVMMEGAAKRQSPSERPAGAGRK